MNKTEIDEFIQSATRENLYDLIEAIEAKFDARLIKYDRVDIESHLGILTDGAKESLTNDEWDDFRNCWSWRHLEDWIVSDDQNQWNEELEKFMPTDEIG
jgi:hypothetical protein